MHRITLLAVTAAALGLFLGCQTTPKTPQERAALENQADSTLQAMIARDKTLQEVLDKSHGYVVFPSVGEGGAIAGAAYGRGIAYERGRPTGYVELKQGSIGLQLGGQTFSEIIVFEDEEAYSKLHSGPFTLGADATATAIGTGVAGETQFRNGMIVFVQPQGGAMAGLAVSGQQLEFAPIERTAGEELNGR